MQVVGKRNTAGNRVRGLLSESSMSERTYLCTLWLCHKTAISAEGKMTCRLMQLLFLTVQLLYSLSLISMLGSEAPRLCHLLTSFLSLFFVSLFVLLFALSLSGPPCAMGFYPNDIFDWHYILSVFFAGSFFGSSVATLWGEMTHPVNTSFAPWICAIPAHNHPFVLASSLTMQCGQLRVFVAFCP